jgi:protein-tyrosine phosphatase
VRRRTPGFHGTQPQSGNLSVALRPPTDPRGPPRWGNRSSRALGDTEEMFEILFVCTGNRCRSPIAEVQLRNLADGLPVTVGSIGLLDLGPAPALPEVIDVGRSVGLDLSHHKARHLSAVDLGAVDLVVGLERSHVAAAVVEAGAPYERAFTLKEIVRLLESLPPVPSPEDPVERARALVHAAHEARGSSPGFMPGEDIEDPFGGTRSAYVEMAHTVALLCRSLVAALFGTTDGSSEPSRREETEQRDSAKLQSIWSERS